MERPKVTIDSVSVMRDTDFAISYGEDVIFRAMNFLRDPEKKKRVEEGECKACFYIRGKIGGAAMTTQPCGVCGKDQLYGSTSTDKICKPCGKRTDLCVHCGGDLLMRPRRIYRPEVANES
jgi:hypothetical protein